MSMKAMAGTVLREIGPMLSSKLSQIRPGEVRIEIAQSDRRKPEGYWNGLCWNKMVM